MKTKETQMMIRSTIINNLKVYCININQDNNDNEEKLSRKCKDIDENKAWIEFCNVSVKHYNSETEENMAVYKSLLTFFSTKFANYTNEFKLIYINVFKFML